MNALHGGAGGLPNYEQAAMTWLQRYLDEKSPTLKNFAKVVRRLEQRQLDESRLTS